MMQASRLLHHPLAKAILWVVLFMGVALCINLAGIAVMGNLTEWEQWLERNATPFLIWRLCLYSVTACGWLRMRRQLYRINENDVVPKRLVRAEIGAITTITLLEASVLLN